MRLVLGLTLGLALLAGAGFWYFTYADPDRGADLRERLGGEEAVAMSTDADDLAALQVTVIRVYADSFGVARIYGEVTNSSDRACQAAQVSFDIRDDADNQVKVVEARVNDIPAQGERSFDIEIGLFTSGFRVVPTVVGAAF